jgi:hypothetical protein
MNTYRVSFYKNLLNSNGHNFKCLQRQVDVESDGPSQALVLAERLIHDDRFDIDRVEVTHLTSDHHDLPKAKDLIFLHQTFCIPTVPGNKAKSSRKTGVVSSACCSHEYRGNSVALECE